MIEVSLEDLKRMGEEVGFDAIGATTADPFPELRPRLESYAKRGLTGFEHEDIEDRINPQRWMPGAKSLISVAMAYLTAEGKQLARQHPKRTDYGVVTVYSYGQDYHHVMKERLAKLADKLSEHVGRPVAAKIAVDTSPLVDRRVAERANIGWIGKNCMFYAEPYGSFVFLGTLAVDVEVEPATTEQSQKCGACDLCLTACPTQALIRPGVIDAKRCLSYVTQMKGIIPPEFRRPMGRRIWGCDVCQWTCPANRAVQPAPHEEYRPHGELEFPDLVEILTMSNRQFQRKYGHTAAAWRGLRTWQRNALIALGNCRSQAAVPVIIPFLSSERPELRASAAWALREIGGHDAKAAVAAAYAQETDEQVREEMAWAVV
jgi:epoxyqueuosine reductase